MRNIDQLEGTLRRLYEHAVPHAERQARNNLAFDMRASWQARMSNAFTLRNTFTKRSVLVEKATRHDPVAFVGSIAEFMPRQEFGAVDRKTGRHGLAIPTDAARYGGSPDRPITVGNRLSKVKLPAGRKAGVAARNRRQRNILAVEAAASAGSGSRFAFLETADGKGIYRVTGRLTKKRGRRGLKVRKVYDLSRDSVNIPKTPLLAQGLDRAYRRAPALYEKALLRAIEYQWRR